MPHRAELFESLDFLKNHTITEWEEKMITDYTCKECGVINSPYSINCKNCNTIPASPFTGRNMEKIKLHLGLLNK